MSAFSKLLALASLLMVFWLLTIASRVAAESPHYKEMDVRSSVERALPLLERASAGSAEQRQCFTCHSQAMPVLAFVEAKKRGFHSDPSNLERQIEHTYAHLKRGRENYRDGKGQGGGVDTAGYALWTLEDGGREADDVTDAVVEWLLTSQSDKGFWKTSSDRPPSEASHFTTTYLALRALAAFGRDADSARIESAKINAAKWLSTEVPNDTEDQVFCMLSAQFVDLPLEFRQTMMAQFKDSQREDGGWAQLKGMASDAYAAGTVLYALNRSGMSVEDVVWQRGIQFLLTSQHANGSWHVVSRSKPFQTYFESGFPHGKDQFISTSATSWATICLLLSLPERQVTKVESLVGTQPLEWPESDLSGRLMFGAHRFIEKQIDQANTSRHKLSISTEKQQELQRTELQKVLGVVEDRLPPRLERYGDDDNPALVAQTESFAIHQVRWPVLGNIFGEGLFVQQRVKANGMCVVIPDADQTPEQLLGLADGINVGKQIAMQLANQGFDLLIPTIVSRSKLATDDERLRRADITEREWIHRQAFHMGRHVIGYDIQRVLAAVDWFASRKAEQQRIGVVGYGEGGMIAMHAAALDTRIENVLISGYFDSSNSIWSEPIYRNIWRRSHSHGNAEVASLILPRKLIVEHSEFPTITGHKGEIKTPEFSRVKSELGHIRERNDASPPTLIVGNKNETIGPWSAEAVSTFLKHFGPKTSEPAESEPAKSEPAESEPAKSEPAKSEHLVDKRLGAEKQIADRQRRCVAQLETHIQSLVQQSEHLRDQSFLFQLMPDFAKRGWSTERKHAVTSPDSFVAASKDVRKRFQDDAIGRFDAELLPPNARTRKVLETDKWVAYDVVLDVHDQLFAWGVLLLPKDLKPSEKRPVVVCQHGRNGVPRDTIDANQSAYNNFAAELADRGFITFAPHNLYRGEDEYRWLDRKAKSMGCTLFSFIVASHDQTLKWLDSLPFVDGNRIAFYGLSYGGETAVRVPTILEKYCLSICSGDFNQWTRKVASTDQPFSFMNTIEWEMPYWNLGSTFDYAEMAYLMFPRPFMVERGHNDGVGRDQWVAHEFAKVRWLYAQFGLSDRVAIEFFQGGHSINGEGTFEFLHQHLDWPDLTQNVSQKR
ncbi:MAG: dienelactone hydrolase family protein [Pirellula staleyi]